MPTYEYACKQCAERLEVVQSFQDDPLTECPSCDGGELRKVFSAAGIIFKGSGWHIKDYGDKKKASSTAAASTSGESSSSDSSSSKDSSSSTDASASSSSSSASKDGHKPTGNVKTFDTKASKAGKPGTNAPKKPTKAASD